MGPIEYVVDLILTNSDPNAEGRPTNEKIFLDTYQGKNKNQITEADLTQPDLEFLKQLVQYRENLPPRRELSEGAFGNTTRDYSGFTKTVSDERKYYADRVAEFQAQKEKYSKQLLTEKNPVMRENLKRWSTQPDTLIESWSTSANNPNRGVPVSYVDYEEAARLIGDMTLAKEPRGVARGKTPAGSMETLLGQFRYNIDPSGNVIITDKYDFNPPQGKYGPEGAAGNVYNTVRKLAGEKIPPGQGRDVLINLGKLIAEQQKGNP